MPGMGERTVLATTAVASVGTVPVIRLRILHRFVYIAINVILVLLNLVPLHESLKY